MKYLFLISFLLLCVLSVVAEVTAPQHTFNGKKTILWASDDNPERRQQIALFNENNPKYHLKLDAINNGLNKILTQSVAGLGPNAFDGFRNELALLKDAGMLYDITGALKAHGITLKDFWPLARPAMSIDGHIYGIPANCGGDAVWYHRRLFIKAGVPFPPDYNWKWKDFVKTAEKLTVRNRAGQITRFGIMAMTWQDIMLTEGGRIFTPDGRHCIADSPADIAAVQKYMDLQFKYHVMPTPREESSIISSGGWASGPINMFEERKAAMACGGRWWLVTLQSDVTRKGKFRMDLGVAEKPVVKYPLFEGGPRVAYVNGLSPHPKRAIAFMLYLCSNKYSDELNRNHDALPGVEKAAERPAFHYSRFPGRESAGSPVWLALAKNAVSFSLSPYITDARATRILRRQVNLVRAHVKSVAAGLRRATALINAGIRRNVRRSVVLKNKYDSPGTAPELGNRPWLPGQPNAWVMPVVPGDHGRGGGT